VSEPEEVILEGAHIATTYVAELWRRNRGDRGRMPGLSDLRRRLDFFVAAYCAGAPAVGVAEPPAVPHLLARVMRRIPRHLASASPHASTDGHVIRLPRSIAESSEQATLDVYLLLALGQALRAERDTSGHVPTDSVVRDLYLLSEAVAVDAAIARAAPGLRDALCAARARAREGRPASDALTPLESAVERLHRAVLDAPPDAPPPEVPVQSSAPLSLAWAGRMRAELSATGRYRGLPAVALWGRPLTERDAKPRAVAATDDEPQAAPPSGRTSTMTRRPKVREEQDDEDDEGSGMWMVPIDDREEKAEDPMGLTRPADRDDMADPAELADALSELPEARVVLSPGAPREVLASDDPPAAARRAPAGETRRIGIVYPEWDWRAAAYLHGRVIVKLSAATAGSDAWIDSALRRNGRLVRHVRRHFERLRPRRQRMGRQPDGPDVDTDAYVAAFADRLAGSSVDDRLYQERRPLRRELAIALLVDASASTDSWVAGDRRIIDVEKDALLVVAEALDALGDRYAIDAFSGEGPEQVRVSQIKRFVEPYDRVVRGRIAGLEPDRYTRLGAAIRHSSTTLSRERCRHRLLLVLSDGKPNDVDVYEGRYGIEDTRQAVFEAKLQGIRTFCITVDREAPIYLPRIFGSSMAVLRRADTLPRVLIDVVRRLIVR
jgi:nitric oxide reductase NorD protein